MPLTPKQAADIEAAKFIDSQFGQLDLSGCPSALEPPPEDELPDERFAPLDDRGVGLGAVSLKAALEEMVYDRDVQEQVARETGNPDLLADLQAERAEQVAREFRRQNPSYFKSQANWERLVQTLAYSALGWEPDEADPEEAQAELIARGFWSVENLTAAFKALAHEGELDTNPAAPRSLSEHQRRSIALQASTGDVEGAIERYLHARLPEAVSARITEAFGSEDVMDQLADPQWNRIIEEAVWFCWQYARPNYAPTTERKQFMNSYVAGRIPTAALLDEAWRACQEVERDVLRDGVLRQVQEQEAPPDLDSLSDEEINSLYHQTRRRVRTAPVPAG